MKPRILLIALCSMSLFACRKTPDTDQLSTSFAVQTSKESDANFASYKTYYIADSIKLRTTDPDDTTWNDAKSAQLVKAVKDNMAARGYTLVASQANNPDLGLMLTAIKDLNVGVIYPGWWYGGWGGCYWYYYCGYYPYYPYGGIVYSIPTGTLILDMIDLKNAVANNKLVVPWSSVMSGGLGYTNDDIQLGVEAINQAYTQSPYISTK